MATKTWFGRTGQFDNPRNWDPTGVPQSGDQAVIAAGTVHVSDGSLLDVPIHLGSTDANTAPVLIARNEEFGRIMVGSEAPPPGGPGSPKEFANMVVGGVVTINNMQVAGSLSPANSSSPADFEITLKNGAVLDNTGSWVEQPNGTLNIDGDHRSAFINDGSVTSIGGSMDVGVSVFGQGTFEVEFGRSAAGSLTFESTVGAGETVNLRAGPSGLTLNEPMKFLGQINEGPSAAVILPNQTATSSSYENGTLSIFNDQELIAALRIASVTGGDFQVANFGSAVQITVLQSSSPAMATLDPSVPSMVVPAMAN